MKREVNEGSIMDSFIDVGLIGEAKRFQEEFKLDGEEAEKVLELLRKRRRDWKFRYP
ncbi:MAG: hypothetical protein ACP6IP_08425 [Candidatus Njordarchaeia archaeon]